jgi:hypothetical protein
MSRIRSALVGIVAAGLLLMSVGVAHADNLQQTDLVATPATHTVEVGQLDATRYQLTANNGDGQDGCNASDGSPANVSINVPDHVTASPSSLTLTACGQANGKTVNFSADEPGDYLITASVSDSGGQGTYNTNPATFTLHVTAPVVDPEPVDHTPPVITAPADMTVEATGPSGAVVPYSASATDDVDGPVNLTSVPASGSTFPLGTTTVNLSATDAAGNSASGSFKVTVVDTTPPALAQLPAIILDATSAFGAVAHYGPATASDLVDGDVPVDFSIPSGSTFPLGQTTVTYSATYSHGNEAEKSFVMNVTVPWNGLNQPINRDGSSSFKLGSTVPVKFNSFVGLNARLSVAKGDNSPDGTDLEAINSNPADTGTLFRYDAVAGQYIFNLGTKNLTAGDWYLHVFLGDGVDHVTKISLRK